MSTRYDGNQTRSDIYNVINNSYKITGNTNIGRATSQLITLGNRVFVLAGRNFKNNLNQFSNNLLKYIQFNFLIICCMWKKT